MNIALVYTNSEANVGRGAGYILGALEAAGHRASFFDTHRIAPEETARPVANGRFDPAYARDLFEAVARDLGVPCGCMIRVEHATDYGQVSIFYPFPGTRLYDYGLECDLIDGERVGRPGRYYEEPVLKGRTVQPMRQAPMKRLNPLGFRFPAAVVEMPGMSGLRLPLATVAGIGMGEAP